MAQVDRLWSETEQDSRPSSAPASHVIVSKSFHLEPWFSIFKMRIMGPSS